MVKKVRVGLFGFQKRSVMIDRDATDGATVGKDLRWPSGEVVTEQQILSPQTPTTTDPGTVSPTLWELILGIPAYIVSLSKLLGTGFVVKGNNNVAEARTLQPQDFRVKITDGDGIAGDPVIGIDDWPQIRNVVPSGETAYIAPDYQAMVMDFFDIEGTADIEGSVYIIGDQPDAPLLGPAFTYDLAGNLTQIDYNDGSQKIFTYNVSGDLERLDSLRDGLIYRKDFNYVLGELDSIDEYYV